METITPEVTQTTEAADRLDQVSRTATTSRNPRLRNEDGTFMAADAQDFFLALVEKNKPALGLVSRTLLDETLKAAEGAAKLAADIRADHKDTLAQFKAFVDSTEREIAALKADIDLLSVLAPAADPAPATPAVKWDTTAARQAEAKDLILRLHAAGMAFGANYHFVEGKSAHTLAKCANGVEVHVYADHARLWAPAKTNAQATVESAIAQLEYATATTTAYKSGVKVVLAY